MGITLRTDITFTRLLFSIVAEPTNPFTKMKLTLTIMLCAAVFVVSEAVFRVPIDGPCVDAEGNAITTEDLSAPANTLAGLEDQEDCVQCWCNVGDAWYCDVSPCGHGYGKQIS